MNLPAAEFDEEVQADPPAGVTERLKLWFISTAGYWAIRIMGSTLRWNVVGR